LTKWRALPAVSCPRRPGHEIVGQHYFVYVRLPAGYAEAPDREYPAVYILDEWPA
jgi:hypothetical protein